MKKIIALILALLVAMVPMLGLADAIRIDMSLNADEAGCTNMFGEEYGPAMAELLNKMSEMLWITDDGMLEVQTVGSTTLTNALRIQDNGNTVLLYTSLLNNVWKLSQADLASMQSSQMSSADMEALQADLAAVKWSYRNTTSVLMKLTRNISTSSVAGYTKITLTLTPDLVQMLIEALAKDALSSKGLDVVMEKYGNMTDFKGGVESFRALGVDFATKVMKSDIVVDLVMNSRGTEYEISAAGTLNLNGDDCELALSAVLNLNNGNASLLVTEKNTATGEVYQLTVALKGNSFTAKLEGNVLNGGVLSYTKLFDLTVQSNTVSLTVKDESILALTLVSNGIVGTVLSKPFSLTMVQSADQVVVATMVYDTVLAVLEMQGQDSELTGTLTCTKDGITAFTGTVYGCRTEPDWTWEQVMSAPVRNIADVISDQAAMQDVTKELMDGLVYWLSDLLLEIPEELLPAVNVQDALSF